jgi:hypothetical protein
MLVIPTIWEAEVRRSWIKASESKASVKPYLKNKQTKNTKLKVWYCSSGMAQVIEHCLVSPSP